RLLGEGPVGQGAERSMAQEARHRLTEVSCPKETRVPNVTALAPTAMEQPGRKGSHIGSGGQSRRFRLPTQRLFSPSCQTGPRTTGTGAWNGIPSADQNRGQRRLNTMCGRRASEAKGSAVGTRKRRRARVVRPAKSDVQALPTKLDRPRNTT